MLAAPSSKAAIKKTNVMDSQPPPVKMRGTPSYLIDQYPEDETAIIEMVATWLVKLGVQPEGSLQGFV